MLVGFASVRPAEFVVFEVEQADAVFVDGSESGDLSTWTD